MVWHDNLGTTAKKYDKQPCETHIKGVTHMAYYIILMWKIIIIKKGTKNEIKISMVNRCGRYIEQEDA